MSTQVNTRDQPIFNLSRAIQPHHVRFFTSDPHIPPRARYTNAPTEVCRDASGGIALREDGGETDSFFNINANVLSCPRNLSSNSESEIWALFTELFNPHLNIYMLLVMIRRTTRLVQVRAMSLSILTVYRNVLTYQTSGALQGLVRVGK